MSILMKDWYSAAEVTEIIGKWKEFANELAMRVQKSEAEESYAFEELAKVRETLRTISVELGAADETLRELRGENYRLRERNDKLEYYALLMDAPSPQSTVRVGKCEHVWITHPLTAEEIFHKIEAQSCSLLAENQEQMERVIAAFDLESDFTPILGRVPHNAGSWRPRPGAWSLKGLGIS
jgi:predicted nuclease with TOPRIM domain